MYIEIVNTLTLRGEIVPLENLDRIAQETTSELYRSIYNYGEEIKEYIQRNNSIAGFDGIVNIDTVFVDIDGETEIAYMKLQQVLAKLESLNVPERSYQVYFSGRGFHIHLHPSLFNIQPSKEAHKELKRIIGYYFSEADLIYDKIRLIRVNGSLNKKTGLYKIPLTHDEIKELTPEDIQDLAKEPRWDTRMKLKSAPHIFVIKEKIENKETFDPVKISRNKYNCIHNILGSEPPVGERHNHLLRLASHFHRHGYSQEVTRNICSGWVNDPKKESDINKVIKDVYQWDSYYSCKDSLLQRYCDKNCIFYEGTEEVFSIKEMYTSYIDRIKKTSEVLRLGKILNTFQAYNIYAGELVSLLGATGMGKSLFMQNIVARTKLPTLIFSLEMPPYQMYRRFVQILTGKAKNELTEEDFKRTNSALSHIYLTPKAVYPNEISKMVESYKPKILVIDHYLLMKSQHRDEYARVSELTAELKQLALKENLIIIGVSQVARDSAKEGLTVHSGKGSGSIENDSDKVLGFNKPSRLATEARITSLKDREGQNLDINVNIENFKIV